ncbi:MAG: tripartite tricarboxylate transporter permease [Candidatus Rokuibacteriota bacterium]
MDAFVNLLDGFQVALAPYNLFIAASGVFLGVVIGVLPGLGGTSGVAILLPLTFAMPPTSAVVFLSSIYWGALFGGVITSILFNMPGESWSVAVMFDGYPMARAGKAGLALATAFIAGFFAALASVIMFTFFAPPLAELALKFGPPETFAILLLAFGTFASLGGSSPSKTIASTVLGFLLGTVGLDFVSGSPRLTFGTLTLLSGFSFVVAAIGMFGIGEILQAAEHRLEYKGVQARVGWRDLWETVTTLGRNLPTFVFGTIAGFWIGVLPATGATPASFVSYGLAKQYSKNREKFGSGAPEGVIATESAVHAAGIGALLPMITLGIPGSTTSAVILGGLYIWGLTPGPALFVQQKEFVWGLIASMYIANVIGVVFCLLLLPLFAAILKIPAPILTPIIVLFSAVGAFAVDNRIFDVWLLAVFGLIGYAFKKAAYPLAPFVVALVLGDMTEQALRQSLILSDGSLGIFFTRPIAASFTTIALVLFFLPALITGAKWVSGRKGAAQAFGR